MPIEPVDSNLGTGYRICSGNSWPLCCSSMHRLISALLIPLLLVSQSVCFVSHSHAGTSVSEPHGHAVRPHFHIGSAHHHHHVCRHCDASEGEQVPEAPADHDSDAVYASDVHLVASGKSLKIAGPDCESSVVLIECGVSSTTAATLIRLCAELRLSLFQRQKCALYLQHLSIRC